MKTSFTHTTSSRHERLTFGFIMRPTTNDTRKWAVGAVAALALGSLLPSLASAQAEEPVEEIVIQQTAPPTQPTQPVVVNGQIVQVPAEGGLGGYAGGRAYGGNAAYNYDFFASSESGDEAEDIKQEIKQAEATLSTLKKKESDEKDDTKKKRIQDVIKNQEVYINELKERQKSVEKYAYLNKKVDVTFKDATIAQAAEALAKASGVTIKVDDAISDTTRLTVTARKIRLVTVLENIGRQADLIIEPIDGGSGVQLTVAASLEVNGVKTMVGGRPFAAPWSEAWGKYPPGSRRRFSLFAPAVRLESLNGLNGNIQYEVRDALKATSPEAWKAYGDAFKAYDLAAPSFALTTPRVATTVRGVGSSASGGRTMTMKVTSEDGGTVVITEAGTNKETGEKGYFITVYKAENGKLNKIGTTFHKSLSDDAAPKTLLPAPNPAATPAPVAAPAAP